MSAASLGVAEVAKVLGVDRSTLYRRLAQGNAPPSFVWGGRRLFPLEELRGWLADRLAAAKEGRPRLRAERALTRAREMALQREAEATMRPRRVEHVARVSLVDTEALLAAQRRAVRASLERLFGPTQARGYLRLIAKETSAPEREWLGA